MDKSGICSQAGFAFQVKVFLGLAASLQPGETLHYEYLDDIAREERFDPLMANQNHGFTIAQVKHTNVSKNDIYKIFTNWQIAYFKNPDISEFKLYVDSEHSVSPFFEEIGEDNYIEYVARIAKDHESSLMARALREVGECSLRDNFSYINDNKSVSTCDDICATVESALGRHLHWGSIERAVYQQRCSDLEGKLLSAIADSMLNCQPYHLTHDAFMGMCEDTCASIRVAGDPPSFSAWFTCRPPKHLFELEGRREIAQLRFCYDDAKKILEHYYYGEYYQDLRFQRYESGNNSLNDDIEWTTYANHQDVVDGLCAPGSDTPIARLRGTKERNNSRCRVEQEKWGSCIYLTKDSAGDLQISWKEEDDNG